MGDVRVSPLKGEGDSQSAGWRYSCAGCFALHQLLHEGIGGNHLGGAPRAVRVAKAGCDQA